MNVSIRESKNAHTIAALFTKIVYCFVNQQMGHFKMVSAVAYFEPSDIVVKQADISRAGVTVEAAVWLVGKRCSSDVLSAWGLSALSTDADVEAAVVKAEITALNEGVSLSGRVRSVLKALIDDAFESLAVDPFEWLLAKGKGDVLDTLAYFGISGKSEPQEVADAALRAASSAHSENVLFSDSIAEAFVDLIVRAREIE